MRILIAPDSFKGSISSIRFCEVAAEAVHAVCPDATVDLLPLADGGEGTVAAILHSVAGERVSARVLDPLGNEVLAEYGLIDSGNTAVIEFAAASGLPLVPLLSRNPEFASSYGTGQLIYHALEHGCRRIIIGLGGSATNDGGAGALQALGFELRDWKGRVIALGARGLARLDEIRDHGRHPALAETEFFLAADVDTPMLGPDGAAPMFAAQKGASIEQLPKLERALEVWNQCLVAYTGEDYSRRPGGGAAGGAGAGFMALLNAELRPGFDVISELTGLEQRMQKQAYDLLLTGEGQVNAQSLHGKLPVSVARLAARYQIPAMLIAGDCGDIDADLEYEGIRAVFPLTDRPMTMAWSMEHAEETLARAVRRAIRCLNLGRSIAEAGE